jgi:hypothetical protein
VRLRKGDTSLRGNRGMMIGKINTSQGGKGTWLYLGDVAIMRGLVFI